MGSIAAESLIDLASGSASRPRQIKVECPIVRRGSV
jgi:DNA-binding LacI/PurR family transcriptional regulator